MKALITLSLLCLALAISGIIWLYIHGKDSISPVKQDTAKMGLKTH